MRKTIFLSLIFGVALASAGPGGGLHGRASLPVAIYPCSPELQAALDEHGLPVHGSAVTQAARATRVVPPLQDGRFRLEGLAPGRYYVETPPLYFPGDNPDIDNIFAGGGCVYFAHRRSQLVEVVAGENAEVNFE